MAFMLAGFAFAGSASADPSTTTVDIKLGECGIGVYFCFVPSTATVSVGDTVRWTDQSGFTHAVTRCDPQDCEGNDGGTGSDGLPNGIVSSDPLQDFSHTFSGPGTYVYYCALHGYAAMNGIVTVAAAEDTSTTTTTTTTTTAARTPTAAATDVETTTGATGTAGETISAATPVAMANNAEVAETTAPQAELARTGANLRLVAVGLSAVGLGVALVSAEHRTRRTRKG